ncbi:hypothetical protein [Mesorhizobium sp. L103C131B0]|uniref:hypothetical protein n=1 Tax=Mesorhizobium sp. L103C131B0 TaxID=1287089 RepID=UPI0003CF9CFC|nr:hypothetical protein [Mesorhizobium sp. L103C131B0]ESZ59011.1 hypothetical protein X729_18325 [Mesorhizobium sp. L103C131B0]
MILGGIGFIIALVYVTLSNMPSAGLGLQQVLVDSGGLERRKCYGRTAASIPGLRDQSARIPIAPWHEFDFITKVGRIDHAGALAMLQRHMGDIEAVFFGTDVLAKALDQPAE